MYKIMFAILLFSVVGLAQATERDDSVSTLLCENALYSLKISTTYDLTPTLTLKSKATGTISVLARNLVNTELSDPSKGDLRITASTPCKSTNAAGPFFLVTCVKGVSDTKVEFLDPNGSIYPWTVGPAIFYEVAKRSTETAVGTTNEIELTVKFYKFATEVVSFDVKDCRSF